MIIEIDNWLWQEICNFVFIHPLFSWIDVVFSIYPIQVTCLHYVITYFIVEDNLVVSLTWRHNIFVHIISADFLRFFGHGFTRPVAILILIITGYPRVYINSSPSCCIDEVNIWVFGIVGSKGIWTSWLGCDTNWISSICIVCFDAISYSPRLEGVTFNHGCLNRYRRFNSYG